MDSPLALFWFRRDLRLEDNAGLYHALKGDLPVLPVFIFDKNILDELEDQDDARLTFIHRAVSALQEKLKGQGSGLYVAYGKPEAVLSRLMETFDIRVVYTNHDYEPYAKKRDQAVKELLSDKGIEFKTYKDQVIFEGLEVEKKEGGAYTVFSPYGRMWRKRFGDQMVNQHLSYYFQSYPTEDYFSNFAKVEEPFALPSLKDMGFRESSIPLPDKSVKQGVIKNYDKTRNFPAVENGTSRLGIHFRFGTISIREKARKAQKLNDTYLNELIWRDFYAMILDQFPRVVHQSFRPEYDAIEWRNNEEEFEKWKAGKTGFPMVDAGMRELAETGYMHNRVRMLTASFLTKHLLIDWRWGEAWFARKLLDFELSSNNGGWQWAAGSGTDAAPYFRIFNPTSQLKKFDPDLKYVWEWVPEYDTDQYPKPIVDHKEARERCLRVYKEGLERGRQ